MENRAAIIEILSAALLLDTRAAWQSKLEAVGVPCGPVQTLDQVVAHPQTAALGILQTSPDGGLRTIGLPLSFDGQRPGYATVAPGLGAHTGEVLKG